MARKHYLTGIILSLSILTIVLLVRSIAIPSVVSNAPPLHPTVDARELVSDIDTFLETGELDLPPTGSDSSHWLKNLELAGLRESYPELEVLLLDVNRNADRMTAMFQIEPGPVNFPEWLSASVPSAESLVMMQDLSAISAETMILTNQLTTWHPTSREEFIVHLGTGETLEIVRISLESSDKQGTYLRLPGPAVYAVQEGSFEIFGNGAALLSPDVAREWVKTDESQRYEVRSGATILVPNGYVVMHVGQGSKPVITAGIVVPTSVDFARPPQHEGDSPNKDLKREFSRIAAIGRPGPHQTSFGQAEVLTDYAELLSPGNFHMVAGWLAIPGGTHVGIDLDLGPAIVANVVQGKDTNFIESSQTLWVMNGSQETSLLLTISLVPASS